MTISKPDLDPDLPADIQQAMNFIRVLRETLGTQLTQDIDHLECTLEECLGEIAPGYDPMTNGLSCGHT